MKEIRKATVIGGGLMGSGIAQVICEAGIDVCINDIKDEFVEKSINGIFNRWESKVKKGKITEETCLEYKAKLSGNTDLKEAASGSDIVIEAASENFNIKKSIFNTLGEVCPEDTIFCSNTSSIEISKLAAETGRPEKFIGTHFFSPVPVMKLLEVIPGILTDDETLEQIMDFGKTIGKTCIISKDTTGFIVNKLLDPMLNEAAMLVENGIGSVEDIDTGMKLGLNHPMGPLELMDMVGIDVHYAVMQVIYAQTGNPGYAPAPLLRRMYEAGLYGKKVGKGFYIYNEDGTKYPNPAVTK